MHCLELVRHTVLVHFAASSCCLDLRFPGEAAAALGVCVVQALRQQYANLDVRGGACALSIPSRADQTFLYHPCKQLVS